MNDPRFIVRTWTLGETDFQEDVLETRALAEEFAAGSRLHGFETEIREKQPDLFDAVAS